MEIEKLTPIHFPALFEFEQKNQSWFEKFVPPRPQTYSEFVAFSEATKKLLKEHEQGTSIFFILINEGKIIARANITDIEQVTAEIGYRVCESMAGQGVASKAVSLLVTKARNELKLAELHAKTTTNNIASMRVLEKNGFIKTHVSENAVVLNETNLSFVHYRCILKSKR